MKIRGYDKQNDDIKLQMTPMIDIVFQLLVFFIMTYKVTAMEGDYNIRMPSVANDAVMQPDILEDFLQVRLVADDDRFLKSINVTFGAQKQTWNRSVKPNQELDVNDTVNVQSRAVFRSLNDFVINVVGSGSGDPGSAAEIEAEIEADFDLRYEDTVYSIEALSGYKDDDGRIIKLIEKIKFRDTAGG